MSSFPSRAWQTIKSVFTRNKNAIRNHGSVSLNSTSRLTSQATSSSSSTSARPHPPPKPGNFNYTKSHLLLGRPLPNVIPSSINYLAESTIPNAGNGVYAGKSYRKGEFVEINPFLELQPWEPCPESLQTYKFDHFGKNDGTHLAIMGFGSYMNHCKERKNVEHGYFVGSFALFSAVRDIDIGEELFLDYGDGYDFSRWDKDSSKEDNAVEGKEEKQKKEQQVGEEGGEMGEDVGERNAERNVEDNEKESRAKDKMGATG